MREKDIHKLIEQQDPEAKQRIWERIQRALTETEKQNEKAEENNNGKTVQNKNKLNNP